MAIIYVLIIVLDYGSGILPKVVNDVFGEEGCWVEVVEGGVHILIKVIFYFI